MPNKSKLKMALAAEKGVDFSKLDQKKKAKLAQKEKSKAVEEVEEVSDDEDEDEDDEEEESDEEEPKIDFDALNDSDSDSSDDDEEAEDEEEEEEDIPLSDIESLPESEKEDIIPHQRLTINNISALKTSLKRIALPVASLPFSEHQSVSSDAPVVIADVSDDLNRELAFYAQALEAAKKGRALLRAEGKPMTRPNDYFAEMVKTDDHMEKIRAKLTEEAANKKAAAEARKLRDLKKFGKKVQVAKQQERDKERKQTLEKIKVLKRKRQDAGGPTSTNEPDMFDVALDDAAPSSRGGRGGDRGGPNNKRQKKDAKFGFGGRKKHSKSGDAMSSGDLSGFSTKKMKAGGRPGGPGGRKGAKGGAAKRPGKSRRASAKF